MIDSVKLRYDIEIPREYFSEDIWHYKFIDNWEGCYWCKRGFVVLKYYPGRQRFFIGGKILTLLHNTRVQNFDDIYGAEREMFLDDLNAAINGLFPEPVLDIRNFNATRIDYCINVQTPYVKEYIDFLTKAFQSVNKGQRVNFTAKFGLSGSVYIKTAAEFEKNERRNYTLNFYDKADWCQYRLRKGSNISKADQILADNCLRLEVQLGDLKVKDIVRKFHISNTFSELFDFKIAYDTILSIYSLVFRANETLDYYSFKEGKKAVAGLVQAERVLRVAASHNVTAAKYDRGRREAMAHGVYPYSVLDKHMKLPYLENPMKLIRKKLAPLGVLEAD